MTKHIKGPQQSHLLRRFWENATGFWGKRGPRLSWVLSGILLLTILLNLASSFGMNLWTRGIFDALQERDSHTILFLSMVYLPLLAASVVFSVLQVYARMTTQRRSSRAMSAVTSRIQPSAVLKATTRRGSSTR